MKMVDEGDNAYHMGRFPVTQGQYEAVTGSNPSGYNGWDCASHPVEEVSWHDAMAFCEQLTERLSDQLGGLVFSLPTGWQWEEAAYAGGDDLDEVGWHKGNSGDHTHAVGEEKPNAWGLYDMIGNVAEWSLDKDGDGDPRARGGGWSAAGNTFRALGFRVVLQSHDWDARHREQVAKAERARLDALDTAFPEKVSSGGARRLDLGGDMTLDLIKVGEGDDAYYLGRFPVTQGQYEAVTGSNPSAYAGDDGAFHPVDGVSWHDAMAFCEKLNELPAERRGGLVFTLPTEAQWEKAALAGEMTAYAGGDDLDEVGWYGANSDGHTHAVGLKKPNAWGLYDMSGNVDEWCLDKVEWYDDNSDGHTHGIGEKEPNAWEFYDMSGIVSEWCLDEDVERASRGGSCYASFDGRCRVDLRSGRRPDLGGGDIGFRVAASRSSK